MEVLIDLNFVISSKKVIAHEVILYHLLLIVVLVPCSNLHFDFIANVYSVHNHLQRHVTLVP